jgi:hypothetical protein
MTHTSSCTQCAAIVLSALNSSADKRAMKHSATDRQYASTQTHALAMYVTSVNTQLELSSDSVQVLTVDRPSS